MDLMNTLETLNKKEALDQYKSKELASPKDNDQERSDKFKNDQKHFLHLLQQMNAEDPFGQDPFNSWNDQDDDFGDFNDEDLEILINDEMPAHYPLDQKGEKEDIKFSEDETPNLDKDFKNHDLEKSNLKKDLIKVKETDKGIIRKDANQTLSALKNIEVGKIQLVRPVHQPQQTTPDLLKSPVNFSLNVNQPIHVSEGFKQNSHNMFSGERSFDQQSSHQEQHSSIQDLDLKKQSDFKNQIHMQGVAESKSQQTQSTNPVINQISTIMKKVEDMRRQRDLQSPITTINVPIEHDTYGKVDVNITFDDETRQVKANFKASDHRALHQLKDQSLEIEKAMKDLSYDIQDLSFERE